MKKKLYFENNADPMKFANSINTYVNFVYDTKTGELKLVDSFRGEIKELSLGTATVKEEEQEGGSEGGEGGDQGGTTPDDGGQGGGGSGEGGNTPDPENP